MAAADAPNPPETASDAEARATIDWTQSAGTVNRPLFSIQGFMQIWSHPNPLVLHSFKLTNPSGTQSRLETYIHQIEPENDNADPHSFDWSRLHPDKMIRFVEDRAAFEKTLRELEIEPLSLLCYNVDWLKSGDKKDPVRDKEEWAEFAAAVVESYNGHGADYRPNMRLAQIWNEPNMEMFEGGTRESYFKLFNLTADRLHREYPGVLVGGPSISHAWHAEPKEWMDAFIPACGPKADFVIFHHYGPMGEPVTVITDEVRKRAAEFRAIPGREQGKIMITETDAWFDGWGKVQYILERQFRLLDLSDMLLGVHHFCCLAYNESGNYTFGVIDEQGGAMEGTFWPYWLFRNTIGQLARTLREGPRQGDFDLVASFDRRGESFIGSAVLHNKSEKPLEIDTFLFFAPAKEDRALVGERLAPGRYGVDEVWRVPAGQGRARIALKLAPGEAAALRLQDSGRRHFAFRDLDNQEQPWVSLTSSAKEVPLNESVELTAEVVNTTLKTQSTMLRLANVPQDWKVEIIEGDSTINNLKVGEHARVRYRVTAMSLTEDGFAGPFAWLGNDGRTDPIAEADKLALSIPVSLKVRSPLTLQVLPIPIQAVAGEENQVTLSFVKTADPSLSLSATAQVPHGWVADTEKFEARFSEGGRNSGGRFQFKFQVPTGTVPGKYTGTVTAEFLGAKSVLPFSVVVNAGSPAANAQPLDIAPLLNFDPISFAAKRNDFEDAMGMFSYPGDYTPSARVVRVRGVPFQMPDLSDGKKCAIEPHGERLAVPAGKYRGVAFMGFGHDGKHPGTWTFHYTDGTSTPVASQIPEWCSPAPEGPENFAEAFTAPHRWTREGPAEPSCQLWTWTLATDPSKELKEIELPKTQKAYLFAVTLLP